MYKGTQSKYYPCIERIRIKFNVYAYKNQSHLLRWNYTYSDEYDHG